MTAISLSHDSRTSGKSPTPLAPLSGHPAFTRALDENELAHLHELRRAWRLRASRKTNTALHTLLYCLLLGKHLDMAFSPVTNQRKLANGRQSWGTLDMLLYELHSEHVVLGQLQEFYKPLAGSASTTAGQPKLSAMADLVLRRARAARSALHQLPA